MVLNFFRRLFGGARSDPLAGLDDAARLRLIVGLGNPGDGYARTRHNLGFLTVEEIARRLGSTWADDRQRTSSLVAVHSDAERALVLAKPQTYMNLSGQAADQLLDRLDIEPRSMLVVYDDMDLPFATLRLRERGGPGTHNGMRSMVSQLETEDFPRLRIGINQAAPGAAIDHVLSGFDDHEQAQVQDLVGRAADAALAWVHDGAVVAMNRFNR